MTVALSSKMSGKTHDEGNVDVGTPGAPEVLVGYVGDGSPTEAARSELDYHKNRFVLPSVEGPSPGGVGGRGVGPHPSPGGGRG